MELIYSLSGLASLVLLWAIIHAAVYRGVLLALRQHAREQARMNAQRASELAGMNA